MHKSFLPLFLVSLAGIFAASFLPHEPIYYQWVGLLAGILPLLVYKILLGQKTVLSPVEVDSVYYFGFLVTIITLVTTAIAIALDDTGKPPNMHWILLQFGLGLVATGVALFSRLMLMNKSSSLVEMDVVEASRKLVQSVTEVSGQFDNAGFHAKAFVDELENRLESMLSKSIDTYINSIEISSKKSLDICVESINSSTNSFSNAVSKILDEVGRIQVEAEAISFSVAAEKMQLFSVQIEKSLNEITGVVAETGASAAASIAELASTSRKAQKLATDIAGKLEKLDQITLLQDGLIQTSESLVNFKESISSVSEAFKNLQTTSDVASGEIDAKVVVPLSEGFDLRSVPNISKSISDLEASVSHFSSHVNELGELSNVKQGISLLTDNLNSLFASIADLKVAVNSATSSVKSHIS